MKIVLLLANCINPVLINSKITIQNVLEELEIQVECIELEELPFYRGEENLKAMAVARKIQESNGVIAIASVHIAGMHSAMQNFFEHMMHYEDAIDTKPLFALTYSDSMGEKQASNKMIEAWGMLGGSDGGNMAFNRYTQFESIKDTLEKNTEQFYRVIRQARTCVVSSERQVYLMTKTSLEPSKELPIHSNQEIKEVETPVKSQIHLDLSTKEQNIKELTQLLKSEINKDSDDEFINMQQGVYSRPGAYQESSKVGRKIQNIPHYFISQHDKSLDMIVQYLITDTQEQGVITIKDGDCTYEIGEVNSPTVELTMTSDILLSLLSKEITYQKAFMIGKLKVRGNFIILSKLDQIFKAM